METHRLSDILTARQRSAACTHSWSFRLTGDIDDRCPLMHQGT